MAKEQSKIGQRLTRGGAARSRRELLARQRSSLSILIDTLIPAPTLGWGIIIWTLFIAVCSTIAVWTRQQPLVAVGRIANVTAVARVPVTVFDPLQTQQLKMMERQSTPRVYAANLGELEAIKGSIENLPRTLAAVERPSQIIPEVAERFPGMTEGALVSIKYEAHDGEISETWKHKAEVLDSLLKQHPIVSEVSFQRATESTSNKIEVQIGEEAPRRLTADHLVSVRAD